MSATPPNEKDQPPSEQQKEELLHKDTVVESTPPPSEKGKVSTEEDTTTKKEHHVRWAPLKIPLTRRLQMAAILFYISLLLICLSVFTYALLVPFLWPLVIAYVTFIYLDKAPENGGRRLEWTRHLRIWKYFVDYYPISLVKEADLDPSKNYVFGYHPHGIISMGAFGNFATEATGFSELFPGIKPSLLTLVSNFKLPFYRDIIMSLGIAAVSRNSCENILASGPGRSIVIVVGGAAESLSARPGIADLTLKKRLGFIRLAILHQASLVPTFSFGENDIYEQMDNCKGSTVWKIQKRMQHVLGFTMPLFHARGIFNYDVGIIPFRHPIVTVVGKPIPVPTLEPGVEPTQEQLLTVQTAYIDELQAIYDKYKDVYAKDRIQDLRIIE
ncbi:diacylglycerol acyltransferase-domain-containing protein [Halteromyces radiatus]|uniref:diacylglycerol acyltransferase-domain-containing protein n=1 Tax=Halteromyces radiatus TaxID=101107 RepID=UPI002220319F|nr:diacylglycerol acyltransferase-domain-containing protein [Halteromyces radiatus]KAI8096552.1 diacylglycerol acyltransferase-domain-containing protein [Halteromyces radiatus]